MNVYQGFLALIRKTEVMKEMLQSLDKEPARLLSNICKEYEGTTQPVPDHHLHLSGYIGDISLKALISAGLIKLKPGTRQSLYCYEPTPEGLEQYKKLIRDSSCHHNDSAT